MILKYLSIIRSGLEIEVIFVVFLRGKVTFFVFETPMDFNAINTYS